MSATPWKVVGRAIFDANDEPVFAAPTGAPLAEIVRAVNAHDALVAALREYVATHSREPADALGATWTPCDCALCGDARAALTLAGMAR